MRTRIRELRARYGLSQQELARLVGVRRETILHLEHGRYNPSLRLAHLISRALHSALEDLFIFDDDDLSPV